MGIFNPFRLLPSQLYGLIPSVCHGLDTDTLTVALQLRVLRTIHQPSTAGRTTKRNIREKDGRRQAVYNLSRFVGLIRYSELIRAETPKPLWCPKGELRLSLGGIEGYTSLTLGNIRQPWHGWRYPTKLSCGSSCGLRFRWGFLLAPHVLRQGYHGRAIARHRVLLKTVTEGHSTDSR